MTKTKAKTKSNRKSSSQVGSRNRKRKTVSDQSVSVQIRGIFEDELKCNICTEILIRPTVLVCSHIFCEYCITGWKKQQELCPMCRGEISPQIRLLALDVFVEKALEILVPEEIEARADVIRQRGKKIRKPRRSSRLLRDSPRPDETLSYYS